LATAGAILTVYSISHQNRVNELKSLMSSTIQQAETVAATMDDLHQHGAFNVAAQGAGGGSGDYRTTVLYKSIPVVAAWDSVKTVAKARGFEFLTPSRPDLQARNPKNHTNEYDDAFQLFSSGGMSTSGKIRNPTRWYWQDQFACRRGACNATAIRRRARRTTGATRWASRWRTCTWATSKEPSC
jgi:methyl-accepting chemotaxis protein